MAEPAEITSDTKDWTWTLLRTCPECRFTASRVDVGVDLGSGPAANR